LHRFHKKIWAFKPRFWLQNICLRTRTEITWNHHRGSIKEFGDDIADLNFRTTMETVTGRNLLNPNLSHLKDSAPCSNRGELLRS
jgi:hypothetical protein